MAAGHVMGSGAVFKRWLRRILFAFAFLLLGLVLGPLMEENLRRALLILLGDPSVFFTRPISLGFMIATLVILVIMALPMIKKRREVITG